MLVEMGSVVENNILSDDVRAMVIQAAGVAAQAEPGQFVMVKNESGSTFLRRPFGVADVDREQGRLLLIYRVAGRGTRELAGLEPMMEISVEGPLGGGFRFAEASGCASGADSVDGADGTGAGEPGGRTLLIGGGVGVAPLIYTARYLAEREPGNKPLFLLGVRSAEELFWQDYLKEFTEDIIVTTNDGSAGKKGFAIDALPEILDKYDIGHIKICGPTIMMEGLAKLAMERGIECQVSLEKRMACGIGVCLGCTFEGKVSGKRWKICHDGPVFPAEEVFEK
ncbi:MAG: dihydroorotate dehydrogenase electron transfer subunit [Anaerovibrio sp.]